MERSVTVSRTKFNPETIRRACDTIVGLTPASDRNDKPSRIMSVSVRGVTWRHDDLAEFFNDYRDDCSDAHFYFNAAVLASKYTLSVQWHRGTAVGGWGFGRPYTLLEIVAPLRAELLKVAAVFDDAPEVGAIPEPEKPPQGPWQKSVTVFIGHGRDESWRTLSDSLEKKHLFRTEAFEFGANAGHVTRSILERLLQDSSFALLVMTAENPDPAGLMHARDNVIHEAGLFQGHLGFDRALVVLEDGCEEFSNIHGVQQLRFARGQIEAVVGDVLAALRREFAPVDQ